MSGISLNEERGYIIYSPGSDYYYSNLVSDLKDEGYTALSGTYNYSVNNVDLDEIASEIGITIASSTSWTDVQIDNSTTANTLWKHFLNAFSTDLSNAYTCTITSNTRCRIHYILFRVLLFFGGSH